MWDVRKTWSGLATSSANHNELMRRAALADVPLLVELMVEFYAEGGYELHRQRAAEAFTAIIADERLGFLRGGWGSGADG